MKVKVEIRIQKDIEEPYAVLYAAEMTDEMTQVIAMLEGMQSKVITVLEEERMIVLKPEEIYLVRVEDDKTMIYGQSKKYVSRKRLYELEQILGTGFMRISKSSLINLQYLDYVEPSFGGMMLKLKNQLQDYASRKYLPELRKYLGL